MSEQDFLKARGYAYRLLGRRLYTSWEIAEKLKNRGFEPSDISRVLEELSSRNYINDLDFARAWITTRMRLKPKGENVLKAELLKKGIDKETVQQALDEVLKDYSQEGLVLNLARQRIERLSAYGGKDQISLKTRRKIFSFLRRRGFSSYIILKALRQIFKNDYHQ